MRSVYRPRPLLLTCLLALSVALMGSRCDGVDAVPSDVWRRDVAPAFDYGLYSDAHGQLVGDASGVLLVHRSAHLEKVYADARAGNTRARALLGQLESATEAAGIQLADKALGLGCSALPTCTVRWAELGALIPSPGPGGTRLRQSLARGFERQARYVRLESAVITAAVGALLAGGVMMAVEERAASGELKAGAAEAETLAREEVAETRVSAGVEGAAVLEEEAALEARLREAEASTDGVRQSSDLKVLERLRPALRKPPPGVAADNPRWADYVSYWENRYEELAGTRRGAALSAETKPPLEWPSYNVFRAQVQGGVKFQRGVTHTLRQEVVLAQEERVFLRGMSRPRVDENLGLAHEPGPSLTYVDQLVVDEASLAPGAKPTVHCFSNKQRDFTGMRTMDARRWVSKDAEEALMKYGGRVEIRRPDHPLFGLEVSVMRVHLIYDARFVSESISRVLRLEAESQGVEIHFHAQR